MKKWVKIMVLAVLFSGVAAFAAESAGRAEDAWNKLAGKFANRPEFAFVENNSDLPNVLIYGDSISIHYTQEVRAKMAGKANVYRLFRNGGSSRGFVQVMENMHDVMRNVDLNDPWTFEWDVIHFNVGLHDLKYVTGKKLDKENGKQVTSIDVYKNNLREIVDYLKRLSPSAKLVFATTTPVPEGAQGRFAGDSEKYNRAALEVLSDFPEIAINDLFSFTKPNHAEWWSKPGDVHYNETGQNAQGDEVARVILNAIQTMTPSASVGAQESAKNAWANVIVNAQKTSIQAIYYVSPRGNDRNAGTETSPFKTIEKARDAVRRINKNMTGDIVVAVGGGEYPIDSTIVFNETDSGKNGHYVTYRAKAGETPLLTGGVKVTGWTPVSGTSLYQASVTSVDNFRQIYVNGSRPQRAVSSSTYTGTALHYDGSRLADGLILNLSPVPSYKNPGDMELVQVSNWSFHRVPVNSFAAAGTGKTAIIMENPYFTWSLTSTGHNRFSSRKPFYIENAYELLDTPGEWYLNRSTDTLYYWPLSGEDMATAEVYIPKTETLVQIRGASLTEKVENIRFDGLTFAHTTELRPSTEGAFSQQASKWSGGDGAWAMKESTDYRPKAAVYLEATDGIRFENNVFEHLGGAGLDALNGVSHTLIERNVYRDISDSAIAVGDWCHNYLNTGNACFRMNLSFPNGSIEAQLKRVAEYDGQTEMGLAHFANSGNYVKFYHQNNQWKIAKVITGVTTVMATGPSYPVANNTDCKVKFVVNGTVMEGFVNGVSQCSISDSGLGAVNSPRQVALVADNAKVRFDNVQMVNTDNSSVVREDFENGAFPDWHNIGGKWD